MAAVEGQIIDCHSIEVWNEHEQKAIESKQLVVIIFTAQWCGPCRIISPIVAEMVKKLPSVMFLKVDVDNLKTVAEEYKLKAIPTFVFMKEGKEIDRVEGPHVEALGLTINKHLV